MIRYTPKNPSKRVVVCDSSHCKVTLSVNVTSGPAAREKAIEKGWEKVADIKGAVCELCPKCSKRLHDGKLTGVKSL